MKSSKEPWQDIITQMILLQGLDSKYDILKQHLLVTNCGLHECIQQIQRHTELMKLENTNVPASTAAYQSSKKSEIPYCTHCKKRYHTNDTCFKLHPELYQQSRQASSAATKEQSNGHQASDTAIGWMVRDTSEPSRAMSVQDSKGKFTDFKVDSGSSHIYVNSMDGNQF